MHLDMHFVRSSESWQFLIFDDEFNFWRCADTKILTKLA